MTPGFTLSPCWLSAPRAFATPRMCPAVQTEAPLAFQAARMRMLSGSPAVNVIMA